LRASEFYEKNRSKKFMVNFLLSFNRKLSYFDKNLNPNLNLNQKWLSPTWRKPICSFHGEARVPDESSFTARTINRIKKLIKITKL
jgi:hypothetical protein